MIAAHNAAIECYRRAMIGEQTFEGRREHSPTLSTQHTDDPPPRQHARAG